MDDADALWEQSRDGMPFSNSDEGIAWMDDWCARCIWDLPARQGDDAGGCPLVAVALANRVPAQWVDAAPDQPGSYHCVEFRPESDDDPNPNPLPTPPGQGELIPRQDYESARMLAQPVPIEAVGHE